MKLKKNITTYKVHYKSKLGTVYCGIDRNKLSSNQTTRVDSAVTCKKCQKYIAMYGK